MDWLTFGILLSFLSSICPCADTPTSLGFAGESSTPRENCDLFEAAEVLLLCSVTDCSTERLGGWFKVLSAKPVPRVNTAILRFWCCDAKSDRETGSHEEDEEEVMGSVLCNIGFLSWCRDASSERDSVEEAKLCPNGRLL